MCGWRRDLHSVSVPEVWIASSNSCGKGGSGDLTGVMQIFGMATIHLLVTSFLLSFIQKKNLITRYCSFVYEHLLLHISTGLWHYILAWFVEETPDCWDCRIVHSNSAIPRPSFPARDTGSDPRWGCLGLGPQAGYAQELDYMYLKVETSIDLIVTLTRIFRQGTAMIPHLIQFMTFVLTLVSLVCLSNHLSLLSLTFLD